MLIISTRVTIPEEEIEIKAIRAQGAGGQNVNKVASAIHLRFDIRASSLPDSYKQRLLKLQDQRISKEGVIIIKAQQYRSQEKNRAAALQRLQTLIKRASSVPKKRKPTQLPRSVDLERLDQKTRRGRVKRLRQKISQNEY